MSASVSVSKVEAAAPSVDPLAHDRCKLSHNSLRFCNKGGPGTRGGAAAQISPTSMPSDSSERKPPRKRTFWSFKVGASSFAPPVLDDLHVVFEVDLRPHTVFFCLVSGVWRLGLRSSRLSSRCSSKCSRSACLGTLRRGHCLQVRPNNRRRRHLVCPLPGRLKVSRRLLL